MLRTSDFAVVELQRKLIPSARRSCCGNGGPAAQLLYGRMTGRRGLPHIGERQYAQNPPATVCRFHWRIANAVS